MYGIEIREGLKEDVMSGWMLGIVRWRYGLLAQSESMQR